MIKAIIVDDEKNALEMLEWQLQNFCPQIQVAALCRSVDEGIAAIEQHQPHLVFLDIEMPRRNGFELVAHYPTHPFEVIFTTAYDQFAIRAFRYAALDYLLKPIDADDLVQAVERFERRDRHHEFTHQLQVLLEQYKQPNSLPGKLPFATSEGIVFIKPETIVRCESSNNYTTLFFTDGTKLLLSKTLKDVEDILQPYHFCRIHHSHLINPQQMHRYLKTEGGFIQMSDGVEVPVSRQRKEEVLKALMIK
jgi:two-component system, LytTR family, response regulator